MRRASLLSVFAAFLVSGIQTSNAQNSAAYCDEYARNYAQQYGANGQVVRGAGRGALLGLGIGSFSGNAGRGAAIGAGAGAVIGVARRARSTSHIYNRVYQDCRAGYYD